MKKFFIVIIVVLIIAVALILKFVVLDSNSSKKLELTYKKNAGIPFKWVCEIEDESIVVLDRSYVLKDENKGGKVGAPIYTNYVFKGLKPGTTKIKFKYVNFITNEIDKEEEHTIKVDNNLNISLVVIPIE